ncbi:MAG: flagellar basal body L-ring protein FlgH, partial [Oceanicaulis sp.]
MRQTLLRTALLAAFAAGLAGCAAKDRLSYVGQTPPMSPIESRAAIAGQGGEAMTPAQAEAARLARAQAIAAVNQRPANPNSLWRSNSTTFFGDPRAAAIGDILTVRIDIADRAQVSNQTARSRATSEDTALTNFFGGEAALNRFFNDIYDPALSSGFGSNSSTQGAGSVNRSETIEMTAAAIVTEVMWNGNLVIHGRQEVRINNEVRELLIAGIVRPEDIAADNTIDHQKIAEARISYGG